MQRYKKIGVFLTGSPADEGALGYAGLFAKLAGSETILCVHEHTPETTPAGDDLDVSDFEESIAAALPPEVRGLVDLKVHSGSGVTEILRSAHDLELDLVVKGRRLPASQLGVGTAFTRLARKCPCSVLVVPNQVRPHLSRMLVRADFSEHSRMALDTALAIARAAAAVGQKPQVLAQAVFSVGYGHAKTGLSVQEAAANIEAATRKKLDKFLADIDTTGVEVDAVLTCTERNADAIHEVATARKVDVIVVGSRGLTTPAAAILGSTAEQVLVGAALPVLIVKRKGETSGLLNALLSGA